MNENNPLEHPLMGLLDDSTKTLRAFEELCRAFIRQGNKISEAYGEEYAAQMRLHCRDALVDIWMAMGQLRKYTRIADMARAQLDTDGGNCDER
ncbi:hypothetical protein [Actinobaculum suis]|nr:hypothetical protein [Actinobaculum suis]